MRGRRERLPEHWWARRWIEVLESFDVGRRLGRGRNYARQGQVIDLELGKGFVTAKVQGSRDAPYLVRMRFSMLSSTDWKKIVKAIGEQPDCASRLVIGEMPENVERSFAGLGLSLFPSANGDLKTACSCPDQANPCKHIAAVYYLLGEEFDRDPFLIFRLRGIERGELIDAIRGIASAHGTPLAPAPRVEPGAAEFEVREAGESVTVDREELRERRSGTLESDRAAPRARPTVCAPSESPAREREPERLPGDPHLFWAGAESSVDEAREVRIPTVAAALPKRLGGFPFWRGDQDCIGLIEKIYREASAAGLDVFLGSPEESQAD
ncbi:MAG: SWIM zinc finger family protein [Myxococcales bacterium]|nr:SWIM zinc finger family protein [Myxococcales bacterium]MDH5307126.1 SWIM zinc finger family protein [Myxococcales bacterium]MDH5565607.1 SWIM zinc finger family protein [Myxococcales bacterium]